MTSKAVDHSTCKGCSAYLRKFVGPRQTRSKSRQIRPVKSEINTVSGCIMWKCFIRCTFLIHQVSIRLTKVGMTVKQRACCRCRWWTSQDVDRCCCFQCWRWFLTLLSSLSAASSRLLVSTLLLTHSSTSLLTSWENRFKSVWFDSFTANKPRESCKLTMQHIWGLFILCSGSLWTTNN